MFNTGIVTRIRQSLTPPPPPPSPPKLLEPVPEPPPRVRTPDAIIEDVEFYLNGGVLLPTVPGVFSQPIIDSIKRGDYEAHEAQQLNGLLEPGEVVLEIGAGCGFISTVCAKSQHVSVVHCVEANPALIDIIRRTHRANQVEATVHHEVLTQTGGEVDFYVHQDFWGSGTHNFLGTPIRVPATPFQQRLEQARPTMLVIDIEGGEEKLFDGVELVGVRKIMVELHAPTTKMRGIKHVFDQLSAQNFAYDQDHSARSVVTFRRIDG